MALVDSIYHLIHSSFSLWLHLFINLMDFKVHGCVVCLAFGRQHGAHQAYDEMNSKIRKKKSKT